MHKEIFTKEQLELLPLIKEFGGKFVLVGGTAIALHIGHRRSIDFDLFSYKGFKNKIIKNKISRCHKINKTFTDEPGAYTIFINGIKTTFYHYPYQIEAAIRLDKSPLKLPDLLTLAAMKAFALSRRPKWKDYVDLYFIVKNHYSVGEISEKAKEIFQGEFNERIFREALVYFADVSYAEPVEYMKGFEVSDKTIEKELIKFSLS